MPPVTTHVRAVQHWITLFALNAPCMALLLNNRPHSKVPKRTPLKLTAHLTHRVLQLDQMSKAQFERVLIRLECLPRQSRYGVRRFSM
jgi:hypothetical protein